MARGRARGYDDQREAIVARAAELFARQGYHATSMNQLAEAAGLSKATLYHYYRDKDALLVHIADGHVSRLQALVADVRALGLKPEERFRELVRRIVEEYADAQHAHHRLGVDVVAHRDVVQHAAGAEAFLRGAADLAGRARDVVERLVARVDAERAQRLDDPGVEVGV